MQPQSEVGSAVGSNVVGAVVGTDGIGALPFATPQVIGHAAASEGISHDKNWQKPGSWADAVATMNAAAAAMPSMPALPITVTRQAGKCRAKRPGRRSMDCAPAGATWRAMTNKASFSCGVV